jgi:hypothetical protein
MSDMTNETSKPVENKTTREMHVHWKGYVSDPAPTLALRESGRGVSVYDDWGDEIWLPPTSLPLPAPWAQRYLKYTDGARRRFCGGEESRRFLTNGHWLAVVDEATYATAVAAGWQVVRAGWDAAVYPTDPEPIDITCDLPSEPNPKDGGGRRIYVGGVWVRDIYLEMLREIGVTEVYRATGELQISVPGVAAVMGIRLDHEPEPRGEVEEV